MIFTAPAVLKKEKMAGVLNEFDEPTPLKSTFCAKLTEEQYEEQKLNYTDEALNDLITYLEKNPEDYANVIKKRKKEEAEESGLISYMRVRKVV